MRKELMMEAYLDSYDRISVYLHELFYQGKSESFRLVDSFGKSTLLPILEITRSSNSYSKYVLQAPSGIEIGKEYFIVADYALRTQLRFGYIVRTEKFDQDYYYEGNDLGVTYSKKGCMFVLWAPTASEVKVVLEKGSKSDIYSLKREDKGVWRTTVSGDLDSYTYIYLVKVNGSWVEAVDPYAISSNANKQKGFILNPEKLLKVSKKGLPEIKAATDAIIYETSVRDFTKQFNFPESGKYLGFAKRGLLTPKGKKAGIDHICELGITHIQIMPVGDFASVDEENVDAYYNWGYDPAHYMIPEGSYAMDPNDPYSRVKELQTLVQSIHDLGIRVVFDVVFNHMYDRIGSDFEKIVPNYYFRLSESGAPSNGSFCGNDFDSTRLMARKFILDAIKHWLTTYGIDGYRFDLMGILDVQTMNDIRDLAEKIDPNVILYGEGWDVPTILAQENKAMIANQDQMPKIGHFNDFFRDEIKGSSSDDQIYDAGYATRNLDRIGSVPSCLVGCCKKQEGYHFMFSDPMKTINYVECHDGPTLWDKLKMVCNDEDRSTRVSRMKLMMGLVVLSEGVPFIHSGQEFCRSKQGITNSYASGDRINQIDWNRLDRYEALSDYTRDLIQLRKEHPAFRFAEENEIYHHVESQICNNQLVTLRLYDIGTWDEFDEIIVFFNATTDRQEYALPDAYQVLLDEQGLTKSHAVTEVALVNGLSIMVVARKYV